MKNNQMEQGYCTFTYDSEVKCTVSQPVCHRTNVSKIKKKNIFCPEHKSSFYTVKFLFSPERKLNLMSHTYSMYDTYRRTSVPALKTQEVVTNVNQSQNSKSITMISCEGQRQTSFRDMVLEHIQTIS